MLYQDEGLRRAGKIWSNARSRLSPKPTTRDIAKLLLNQGCHLDYTAVSRLENGKRKLFPEQLLAVAEIYQLDKVQIAQLAIFYKIQDIAGLVGEESLSQATEMLLLQLFNANVSSATVPNLARVHFHNLYSEIYNQVSSYIPSDQTNYYAGLLDSSEGRYPRARQRLLMEENHSITPENRQLIYPRIQCDIGDTYYLELTEAIANIEALQSDVLYREHLFKLIEQASSRYNSSIVYDPAYNRGYEGLDRVIGYVGVIYRITHNLPISKRQTPQQDLS